MEIEFPPESSGGLNQEMVLVSAVRQLNDYFNNDFEERYGSSFDWFLDYLPNPVISVLNVGCDRGRETFALAWRLKADEALGIDLKANKLQQARRIAGYMDDLPKLLNRVRGVSKEEYASALDTWYETTVPDEIKRAATPQFEEQDIDISGDMPLPSNRFYLVYCRYVLDKILEEHGPDRLVAALRNLATVVKPNKGRIVVVVPTRKSGKEIDYIQYFEEAGLALIHTTEENELNISEGELQSGFEPKGYVLKKSFYTE